MYYRYKVKKKDRKFLKGAFVLILLVSIAVAGYKNRQYVLFWKYNYNKLVVKIDETGRIGDPDARRAALKELVGVFNRYKLENQVMADAFFLSGKVHYLLGETYLPGDFSQLLINDRGECRKQSARSEFLKAIKDVKKGIALLDGDGLNSDYSMILAKSCYYISYGTPADIHALIKGLGEGDFNKSIDNVRFYSLISVMNGEEDEGLNYLSRYGMGDDSIQGRLYLATVERIAKRYTNSIMNYKDILKRTSDDRVHRLIYINLGKIYYNQSLYRESLAQFNAALKIDERDNFSRIWIGKNYSALGDRGRAEAIWSEVLAADRSNKEARELLGVM